MSPARVVQMKHQVPPRNVSEDPGRETGGRLQIGGQVVSSLGFFKLISGYLDTNRCEHQWEGNN